MQLSDQCQRRVRWIARCCAGFALCYPMLLVNAAEQAPLSQGQDVIAVPGIGRVAVAFVIVAALAVAAGVALRRVLPKFTGVPLAGSAVRVLERTNLGPGTRIHLVQVEGEKVLVAENRSGLAIAVLGKTGSAGPP
jgi:flagellar biogenesis protein FliO